MAFDFFKASKTSKKHETVHKRSITDTVYYIHPKLIMPNPSQPRANFDGDAIVTLADSIAKYGFIQPLCVRLSDSGAYELVAGERRLRAAKLLSLDRVPCIIVNADRARSAELALVENMQRVGLNFFEQAEAIDGLIEICSYTQSEAAERLSLSQSAVANKLRLLKLSKKDRATILEGGLTERHARAFLKAPSDLREWLIQLCIKYSLNVSETELLCDFAVANNDAEFDEFDTLCMSIRCGSEAVRTKAKTATADSRENICETSENGGVESGKKVKPPKISIKNLGIFINSLERLAVIAMNTGAEVEKRIEEIPDGIEVYMKISRPTE